MYDRNFGTIIDDYEEDHIETSDIEKAINLTRKFIAKINDEAEKSAAIKVCEAMLEKIVQILKIGLILSVSYAILLVRNGTVK